MLQTETLNGGTVFPTDQEAMCGAPLAGGGGWGDMESWRGEGCFTFAHSRNRAKNTFQSGPAHFLIFPISSPCCRADSANLRANPPSVRVQCISDTQVYPISGGVPAHHWHVCALVSVHVWMRMTGRKSAMRRWMNWTIFRFQNCVKKTTKKQSICGAWCSSYGAAHWSMYGKHWGNKASHLTLPCPRKRGRTDWTQTPRCWTSSWREVSWR